MKIVNSDKLPPVAPTAPYSHSVAAGDFAFLSGQVGTDANGQLVAGGLQAEAEQMCKNIEAVLEAHGVSFDAVVKATCFLSDIGNFAAFNQVYCKYFTTKPARSCFAVKDLPLGAMVEVEVIAYIGK